jgi:hypothetical protein
MNCLNFDTLKYHQRESIYMVAQQDRQIPPTQLPKTKNFSSTNIPV